MLFVCGLCEVASTQHVCWGLAMSEAAHSCFEFMQCVSGEGANTKRS